MNIETYDPLFGEIRAAVFCFRPAAIFCVNPKFVFVSMAFLS